MKSLPVALLLLLLVLFARSSSADSMPKGSISYFSGNTCPTGWTPFSAGEGRFIVPMMSGGSPGGKAGTPIKPGDDPTHTHGFSATFDIEDYQFEGIDGCCNNEPTSSGKRTIPAQLTAANLGLPYVALLACLKTDAADTSPPPPSSLLAFATDAQCPVGWHQELSTQGRYLVGLPASGTPGVAFGGGPLAPQELRQHAHEVAGFFSTSHATVMLVSGCCSGGYGKKNTYSFSTQSEPAPPNMAYVQEPLCQKD
ncbi:MAG TPA: hypothetical protein VGC55_12900 [Dokdonella sp.]